MTCHKGIIDINTFLEAEIKNLQQRIAIMENKFDIHSQGHHSEKNGIIFTLNPYYYRECYAQIFFRPGYWHTTTLNTSNIIPLHSQANPLTRPALS